MGNYSEAGDFASGDTIKAENGKRTFELHLTQNGNSFTIRKSLNVSAENSVIQVEKEFKGNLSFYYDDETDEELYLYISELYDANGNCLEDFYADSNFLYGNVIYTDVNDNSKVYTVPVRTYSRDIVSDLPEAAGTYKISVELYTHVMNSGNDHVHSYGEPVFKWTNSNKNCTATFTCEDGDDVQTVACNVTSETTPATEKEDGQIVYTATAEFDGQIYTDTKTSVIPAIGSVDSGFSFGSRLKELFRKWFGGNDQPSEPDTPDNPTEPDEPTIPDEPTAPDEPATPSKPGFNFGDWIIRWWKR